MTIVTLSKYHRLRADTSSNLIALHLPTHELNRLSETDNSSDSQSDEVMPLGMFAHPSTLSSSLFSENNQEPGIY